MWKEHPAAVDYPPQLLKDKYYDLKKYIYDSEPKSRYDFEDPYLPIEKKGGSLPKHQKTGPVKFPGRGYTLEEIKVAGLNRNMFTNPISGNITFKKFRRII